MIVVSDTSPLNYLILVRGVDVLHALYGTVCLPEAVEKELKPIFDSSGRFLRRAAS